MARRVKRTQGGPTVFERAARAISRFTGSAGAFLIAVALVLAWATSAAL